MVDRLTRRGNFDDKPETVLKRVKLYEEKTVPVLEKYCNKTVKVTQSVELLLPFF